MRIEESSYNLDRLTMFEGLSETIGKRPIVSSSVLRGPIDVVRSFYHKLFIEFVGRAELLRIHKVIQGAVNKLCYSGTLGFPVVLHPDASEVHFDPPPP